MADQIFQAECGFFDAVNRDRLYTADQMNRPYKRFISNGVFAARDGSPSEDFEVVPNSGMQIRVKAGEGMFDNKWFAMANDTYITVPTNTGSNSRNDSIIIQVDNRLTGRVGNIVYRTGGVTIPEINTIPEVKEYRLANIFVQVGARSMTEGNITDLRGTDGCPWVTSLVYQPDNSYRIDEFLRTYGVNNATRIEETVLFSSNTPVINSGSPSPGVAVSADITSFDYVDIRYAAFGRTGIAHFKGSDIRTYDASSETGSHWSEFNRTSVRDPEDDSTPLEKVDFLLEKIDATHIWWQSQGWVWDGKAGSVGKAVELSQTNNLGIFSITGINYVNAGSTKDPELTDIRVGANGTTYPTAGEAVRGQIEEVEAMVSALVDPTLSISGKAADANVVGDAVSGIIKNLFDYATDIAITGYGLTSTGGTVSNANLAITDYLDVTDCKTVKLSNSLNSNTFYNIFYDATKTLITPTYPNNDSNLILNVPENAKYVRLTILQSTASSLSVQGIFDASRATERVYESISAVNETAKKNKTSIDAVINNRDDNLFDPASSDMQLGYGLKDDGQLFDGGSTYYIYNVHVKQNAKYFIKKGTGYSGVNSITYVFCDDNYAYISGYKASDHSGTIGDNIVLTPPADAWLMRITGLQSEISQQEIYAISIDGEVYTDAYRELYEIKRIKGKYETIEGYPYVAFSGGCMIGDTELYVSRAGKQHVTPSSSSDWGKLVFWKRSANGEMSEPIIPDLGYDNIGYELRDPNLSPISADIAVLSGFGTKTGNPNTYCSYVMLVDKNLNVLGRIIKTNDVALFWGNTIITPNGYLLHCAYVQETGVYLMRSNIPWNGSNLSGISFDRVPDVLLESINEATIAYWNNKIIVLGRNATNTENAILYISDNLEGTGTWTATHLSKILHAPALLQSNHGKNLLYASSEVTDVSTLQREPSIGIIDASGNIVSSAFIQSMSGELNGYTPLVKISDSDYGFMYSKDEANNTKTRLYFRQVNINRMLNTIYHPV